VGPEGEKDPKEGEQGRIPQGEAEAYFIPRSDSSDWGESKGKGVPLRWVF